MKLQDIKAGDTVILDDGFTCVKPGPHVVHEDDVGLFVCCHGSGSKKLIKPYKERHYLSGQDDGQGELIGVSRP